MEKALLFKIFFTWLAFVPIAVVNGSLRQLWYQKYTGELVGHQTSTLTGALAFVILTYFMIGDKAVKLSGEQLLGVGVFWLLLTIVFEFGMGFVAGRSWSYMLADYNILEGRLWPLFLLVIVLTPYFIKWFIEK